MYNRNEYTKYKIQNKSFNINIDGINQYHITIVIVVARAMRMMLYVMPTGTPDFVTVDKKCEHLSRNQ